MKKKLYEAPTLNEVGKVEQLTFGNKSGGKDSCDCGKNKAARLA